MWKDFKICQGQQENLAEHIDTLISQDQFHITDKYLALDDENRTINREKELLGLQLEDLKFEISRREDVIENKYKLKLRHLEEELQGVRYTLKLKEKVFFDDLQTSQATSALQLDELESNMTWQISEVDRKLQESNHVCLNLRNELQTLKIQNSLLRKQLEDSTFKNNQEIKKSEGNQNLSNSNQESANYELRVTPPLQNQENRYPTTSNAIINPESGSQSEAFGSNTSNPTGVSSSSKYQPLQLACTNSMLYEDELTGKRNLKPTLYKGTSKPYRGGNITIKIPLKQCSDSKMVKFNQNISSSNKKRKLYNPDDSPTPIHKS